MANSIIEIIACSSSVVDLDKVNKAKIVLGDYGFETKIADDLIDEKYLYESNSVDYRLNHLLKANDDSSTQSLMAIRGGYGSAKVANELMKIDHLTQNKFVCGYSDLTALFLALNQKHNWLCIHGPMLISFANDKMNVKNLEQTLDILSNKIHALSISNLKPINCVEFKESISGKLVGGNLTLVQTSIGTSWQANLHGKILFLEDVNEPGYKVDRTFTQLMQTGLLKGVKCIILGSFYDTDCPQEVKNEIDFALKNFSTEMAKFNCPVYRTDAFGHFENNIPLVIGANATISIDNSSNYESNNLVDSFVLNYDWNL